MPRRAWRSASAGWPSSICRRPGTSRCDSADGRLVIVFNGEIYNHRDLRACLEREGVAFRGDSDTEVIARGGSARHGVRETLPELWGMFAIAVWDTARAGRCG